MMNDPKYKPTDLGIIHVEGNYLVPRDEPIMMLRAKDVTSLVAIMAYMEALKDMEFTEDVMKHLESSTERFEAFLKYQEENKDIQSVGCNQKSHSTGQWILCKAKIYNRSGIILEK